MRHLYLVLALGLIHVLAGPAPAHTPLFPSGGASPEDAVVITDIGLSQVVYRPIDASAPTLWLTLDTTQNEERLYVQLGVPELDRLASFRPTLAIIGPGLPPADLPFSVPDGLGAIVLPTASVAPTEFYEGFTGTSSWVLIDQTLTLGQAGRYYVVAFDPLGQQGKLWIAVGEGEDFATILANFVPMVQQTRAFHELSGFGCPLMGLVMLAVPLMLAARARHAVGSVKTHRGTVPSRPP